MSLEIDDAAPDFRLTATKKDKIALSDYRGKKHVVVAFFPLAFTPG